MRLVISPWRTEFNKVVSSAKKELRIVAPFYTEGVIANILQRSAKGVRKYFILALSQQGVGAQSQSIAALERIENDKSAQVRLIRNLHRSEEHTSELQSLRHLVCRLLFENKKTEQHP